MRVTESESSKQHNVANSLTGRKFEVVLPQGAEGGGNTGHKGMRRPSRITEGKK